MLHGPKEGANRAQNMAKQLYDVLDVLGFALFIFIFMGFSHPKMANFGLRTDCNMFLHFLNFQKRAKYRSSDPLFILEIL